MRLAFVTIDESDLQVWLNVLAVKMRLTQH